MQGNLVAFPFFFREKPWDKVECKADRTVLNEETVSL